MRGSEASRCAAVVVDARWCLRAHSKDRRAALLLWTPGPMRTSGFARAGERLGGSSCTLALVVVFGSREDVRVGPGTSFGHDHLL
jgi:hypothetical protein